MIVADPVYGRFELPSFLDGLVQTPEVRRLSQVRLLNCLTPSLATLGEVRRYSHTLGVLYLWTMLPRDRYSDKEYRALAASVLAHDIGTPPFAHLFEYYLKESTNWSHETVIRQMLWGHHAPEDRAHQLFAGRTTAFRSELERAKIDFETVEKIVSGNHPLSKLILGTLDLDNLDNVARMALLLGHGNISNSIKGLASSLSVSQEGDLLFEEKEVGRLLSTWAAARRTAYSVLVFDSPTVAAQAVLSQAIEKGFETGVLSAEDWFLSDEDLLNRLLRAPATKKSIALEYLGRLPAPLLALQVSGTLDHLGFRDRAAANEAIIRTVSAEVRGVRVVPYVFVDNGAFEKRVEFKNPSNGEIWQSGKRSKSVVFYAFGAGRRPASRSQCMRAVRSLIGRLEIKADQVQRCSIADDQSDVQPTLALSATVY